MADNHKHRQYTEQEKRDRILDQMRQLNRPARISEIHAMVRYNFYVERGMKQKRVKVLPRETVKYYLRNMYEDGLIDRIESGYNRIYYRLKD